MSEKKFEPMASATTSPHSKGVLIFGASPDSAGVSILAGGYGATSQVSFAETSIAETVGRAWTDEDRQKWKTIAYEVRMFWETRSLMCGDKKEWALHNAVVESAVIHHRCLTEFLLSGLPEYRKRHETDVAVRDLFTDWDTDTDKKYDRLKGFIADLNREYGSRDEEGKPRREFNTLVAHLTENRGDGHDYAGAFNTIGKLICKCLVELGKLID